jgi:hypothetical protein
MKINEILVEGPLGTLGGIAGSVAKGIGKGLANAVAPGAADKLKNTAYSYNNRVKSSTDAELDANKANIATAASDASAAKMQAANDAANSAHAAAKRARFIAVIKQQADRQGSISMTDIGKQIPKQGEYADPARRREAIKNVAQELQQQGVTVTATTTPVTAAAPTAPATDEPYSIGGQQLDPTKPGDKAIIDKLKTAQATKPKTAPATNPNQPAAGKFDWDEEVHTTDANTPAPSGWVKLKIPPSIQPGKESPYRLVHQKYAQDWIANGWVLAK